MKMAPRTVTSCIAIPRRRYTFTGPPPSTFSGFPCDNLEVGLFFELGSEPALVLEVLRETDLGRTLGTPGVDHFAWPRADAPPDPDVDSINRDASAIGSSTSF